MLRWAQNTPGGVEAFDDQHALLIRAVEIWPNRKTSRRWPNMSNDAAAGAGCMLTAACQAYVDAREGGLVTEAIRARTRETWLAIRATGGLEPSLEALVELHG